MHLFEKLQQAQFFFLKDPPPESFYHVGERDLFALDLHFDLVDVPGDDLLKDGQQIENRCVDLGRLTVRLQWAPLETRLLDCRALIEHSGRGLEFLVFQQPVDQLLPRVVDLLVDRDERVSRQQHLRFDLDQCRGHYEKIGRERDVEPLHHLDVFEILLCDAGDRNVKNVRPLLPDDKQQQVERPGEVADLDLEIVRATHDLG